MHIFLTGFMGSGKTTVGRELARRLAVDFVDLDSEIEARAGLAVRQIFERHGEEEFRRRESEALEETSRMARAVVATGGGLPTRPENVRRMRELGRSVWLDVPFALLASRRRDDGGWAERPLFRDETRAREIFDRRRACYEKADFKVEIGLRETPEDVASRIFSLLER